MADAPELDGRRGDELARDVRELAPYYTEEWDPDAGGVGAGLVDVFAELAAEVTERLDATPEKHRISFFDALGFAARPPQAARVPVQLALEPNAPRNVAVRPGTEAVAAADEEVTFRVGAADAFEATPARLTDVVAVDPARDAVFEHDEAIDGEATATLFEGEDRQAHEWYVGDDDLLSVGAGETVTVLVATDVEPTVLRDEVEWHYYGMGPSPGGGDPSEDWHRLAEPSLGSASSGVVAIELSPAGELAETDVDGTESKWLRCRLPPGSRPAGDLAFEVSGVGVSGDADALVPDRLLANDVPQGPEQESSDESIRPFGNRAMPGDAFYLAATSALTKAGASLSIEFTGSGGEVGELPQDVAVQLADEVEAPTVSWEYWDGSGWSRIPALDDGTADFTADGSDGSTVTFPVPEDLQPTSVAGHEDHWIRARLVGGGYGDVIHVPTDTDETRWAQTTTGSPPTYESILVEYGYATGRQPTHVRTHNALAYEARAGDEAYRPFQALGEAEQTLYLGFDAPLSGGPLQLFLAVDEHPYPAGFEPRVRWERRRPDDDGWTRLDVTDDTEGLTEEGILGFALPEPTRATARFGRERHWLRARVSGETFVPGAGPAGEREATVALQVSSTELATAGVEAIESQARLDSADFGQLTDGGSTALSPCGETVETAPPGGAANRGPPRIRGFHFNTGWARNVRAVDGEVLGSSDGERDQTFEVANPPAIDAEVWVDELTALSEPQRAALEADRPAAVEPDRTGDGELRAFWVRWHEVADLVGSGGDERHYVVEPTEGEIRFGDGTHGRIPPRGSDNVRVSYETGGGAAGNVPPGAVGELKSGLPFVEEVTNPAPGVGGADTESTDAVLERAPRALRDRGRAVMPADYERLAAEAARRIARARCIPAMDADGAHAPGYVTVLVVPRDHTETPEPSVGLLDRVERTLADHAPAGVAGDRLVVRGPSYVGVDVAADVVAGDVGSLGEVENRVLDALAAFLHPLSGRDGDGWDFGDLPTRSDVFALLEGIEGVDHVDSLALTYRGEATIAQGAGEPQPTTAADALVREGTHDVTITFGGTD